MIRNRYVRLISLCTTLLAQAQSPSPKVPAVDSPAPSRTTTFRSELLGISFTFPKSLAVIPLESPERRHSYNNAASLNRNPKCRDTVDQALLAIRDVPLPSNNSSENLRKRFGVEDRPDGNIATRSQTDVRGNLAIGRAGLVCFPTDYLEGLEDTQAEHAMGSFPSTSPTEHVMYLYRPVGHTVGTTRVHFVAAEISTGDGREQRRWVAAVQFVLKDCLISMQLSSNDHDFFNEMLRGDLTIGEQQPAPLFPDGFDPSTMNSPWLLKRNFEGQLVKTDSP
jgi:hypothetical protein